MKFVKIGINFIKDLIAKRYLIYQLTMRDFKSRFVGSWLGLFWSFIQPILMTLILWFVFSTGLRAGGAVDDIPFVVYLLTGLSVWNFFSECLNAGTAVFLQYSFLVKKVSFKVAILPIVKILSSMLIHFCVMIVNIGLILVYGLPITFYWFQFIYYLIAMFVLLLGISWISASLNVFIRDVSHIIRIILTMGFWFSPIIWHISRIPLKYHFIMKLNPMFYIINGYRDSLLYQKGFWEYPFYTLYFWGFCLVTLVIGVLVYSRLRPHFSDVM